MKRLLLLTCSLTIAAMLEQRVFAKACQFEFSSFTSLDNYSDLPAANPSEFLAQFDGLLGNSYIKKRADLMRDANAFGLVISWGHFSPAYKNFGKIAPIDPSIATHDHVGAIDVMSWMQGSIAAEQFILETKRNHPEGLNQNTVEQRVKNLQRLASISQVARMDVFSWAIKSKIITLEDISQRDQQLFRIVENSKSADLPAGDTLHERVGNFLAQEVISESLNLTRMGVWLSQARAS